MPKIILRICCTLFVFIIMETSAIAEPYTNNSYSKIRTEEGVEEPHKISGFIKKMILATSDVFQVEEGSSILTPPPKVITLAANDQLDGSDSKGLADYIFSKPDSNTQKDNTSPEYWQQVRENYLKKQQALENEISNKTDEQIDNSDLSIRDDADTTQVESEEGVNIFLKKRPNDNYRNERLPDIISKKAYNKENSHLPVAIYEEEYKNILFNSILRQDIDTMRALIQRLGTTEVRDENGNTPLMFSIIAGNIIPIKVLLGMGAGVNITNNDGLSPIYIAVKDEKYAIARLLMKAGANPYVVTKNGKTLLMVASENNDAKMVNKLIKEGFDINKKMPDGNTALHFAAMRNSSLVSDILISNGADFNVRNRNGYTPIMIAAAYGARETVSLLIQSGADIKATDALGQDAYALAKNNNHNYVLAMLASEGSRSIKSTKPSYASPIDKNLGKAPIPFKKPEEDKSPSVKPKIMSPYIDKKSLKMPIPKFSEEEKSQM